MDGMSTTLVFGLHILGGAIAMAAGLVAVCARKGGRLHRSAGDVFVVAMVVMAVFAAVLGVLRPGQVINVFIAAFTLYLVATAWLTARRRETAAGTPRIARHLWRMCFGLALTLGSAFTNGFARLLPGPYHVPPAFFAPQLLMLVVMLYWLVRVRFPGWDGRAGRRP